MSDVVGPRNIQGPGQDTPQGSISGGDLQKKADKEIDAILAQQYERGLSLLTENRDVLDEIAKILIKEEKINGKQLLEVIQKVKPGLLPEKAF